MLVECWCSCCWMWTRNSDMYRPVEKTSARNRGHYGGHIPVTSWNGWGWSYRPTGGLYMVVRWMVVLNRVLCTGGPLCTPTLSVSSPLQCRVFSECFGGCQIGYLPHICCYLLRVWSILVLCCLSCNLVSNMTSGSDLVWWWMWCTCLLRMRWRRRTCWRNKTAGISCQQRFKYWVRSTCHIGGSQCGEAWN